MIYIPEDMTSQINFCYFNEYHKESILLYFRRKQKGTNHNSAHCPYSCPLLKTRRFGDWILRPSSGETYSVGPNRQSYSLTLGTDPT
jgi:hypothetical protein